MVAGNPPVGELEEIPVERIIANPRNPRQTFDQNRIERVAASLEAIGLQVPITVYENPKKKNHYILLDGERRFRAAKLLNWQTIPALVVDAPSAKQNAVRMFNIHMMREDWKEIETTWALDQIIKESGKDITDRELQQLTGLSPDRIKNMRRVLEFPRSIQERVANDEIPFQLLVELDKNVLSKRKQEIASKKDDAVTDLSVAELRNVFLRKYDENVETDIISLRRVGTLFDTATKETGAVAKRARSALSKLIEKPEATIDDAYDVGAASSVELSKVLRDMKALPGRLSDLLAGNLEKDQRKQVEDALKRLQSRLEVIAKKAFDS